MTSPVTVSERDLRTLLGIVGDHRSDLPPAGLPPSLLVELRDQIRCDELQFLGQDTPRQAGWFAQDLPADSDIAGDDPDDEQLYWELYWDSVCSYPERTGDVRSVIRVSDFYSVRQWHSTAMYAEMFRPRSLEHELLLCLPAGPCAPSACCWAGGPGRTSPNATAPCSPCCAPTCTRPTLTPNAAAPPPSSPPGSGNCCA
jgi:hypothetical protein